VKLVFSFSVFGICTMIFNPFHFTALPDVMRYISSGKDARTTRVLYSILYPMRAENYRSFSWFSNFLRNLLITYANTLYIEYIN
jgi:hypothetical protein